MTTEHSPLPWTLVPCPENDHRCGHKAFQVESAVGGWVCWNHQNYDEYEPPDFRDAQFIVTACNAHPALVAKVAELEAEVARLRGLLGDGDEK